MTAVTALTCDRCGPSVKAFVSYRRGSSVWSWCLHCARIHHKELTRLGYTRQSLEAMAASG